LVLAQSHDEMLGTCLLCRADAESHRNADASAILRLLAVEISGMANVDDAPLSRELAQRVEALLVGERRVILGITGPPGAGKSTLAASVVAAFDDAPAVHLGMDGFHLADVELERLGRLNHKGAIDTFDGNGYLALLQRIRRQAAEIVYAPGFDRDIEQPIAGSIPVFPQTRLVVTEGNYLLDDDQPWASVRNLLSEVWYVDIPWQERHRRLVARHEQFGKSPEQGEAWVRDVDEANAQRIERARHKADLVVTH
jgi:pantothenate kinase